MALVNLDAVPCPAGEMDVVLGPGWNGVLLHEAVGHGLEGDFNRKGTSAFAGRMGQRVAAPGVTVFDDGSLAGRRGSLSIDDEGTPTEKTVLIENGKMLPRNMRKEMITTEELNSQLREQGIEHSSEVKKAYIEGDGTISIIRKDKEETGENTESLKEIS